MRQTGKQILTLPAMIAVLVLGAVFPPQAKAQTSRVVTSIVTDAISGVALGGYDPVSYFTSAEPLVGDAAFEVEWGGVPWHFANAANRDVFMKAPEPFVPQFGGYGAMSVARGYLAEGNPRVYLVAFGELFLFYSSGNRDAFQMDQRNAILSASQNWPALAADLTDE
jgi:hypothetical protein